MSDFEQLAASVRKQVLEARAAARHLRSSSDQERVAALKAMASSLEAARPTLLQSNARDLQAAQEAGVSAAMLDRLRLDEARVASMVSGLREIASTKDPIGGLEERQRRPSGIEVARMRIPLGVIAMVYEARPNVTSDAAALCVRSGNAVVLRGGREALHSNRAIATALRQGLKGAGFPEAALTLLEEVDRQAILALIQLSGLVDLAIPRGGEGLIRFVVENARVPVVQHFKGVCHVFVEASAELDQAAAIVVNGKTQRPGVCNATECLLVDALVASQFLPKVYEALQAADPAGVELRCDPQAFALLEGLERVVPASEDDFGREFLALVLAVKVVDGLDEALEHVERHGSFHTEAICTQDDAAGLRWQNEVDASCVVVNASTRFNDGGELGLGAEMGISTTKMHAYGPMGLMELTARKFVILGTGQLRA